VDVTDPQLELRLRKCRESLHADFADLHEPATIDQIFDDSVQRLKGEGSFDDYIPALAEKLARDRLKAAAQTGGRVAKDVPEVLFLALHDTGRGQMGAAIMQQLAGDRVSVHSAGTGGQLAPVDPAVAETMREIGIDLDNVYSKPLTPEVLAAADVVITMSKSTGAVEIPEGTRHVDWRVGDPGGAPPDEARRIREDITSRVEDLLDELTAS
jgi:arsenate reductase (thioredoxin)